MVLYEALAGRRPFEGKSLIEVEDEILHRQPKPPRQIADDIPEELERACLRCLAKDMGERYPTAADLARDLGGRKPPRRAFLVGGAFTVISTAVALVFAAWMAGRGGSSTPIRLTAPGPLAGTIDVWVWGSDDVRRRMTLHDAGALPLRPGDQIRIEATLNRPAYAYLFLIDSQGRVSPVYPWARGDWSTRPQQEEPTDRVSLPEPADRGWRVKPPYGTETLVLLARDEPLAAEVGVPGLLTGLPSQRVRDPGRAIWFAEGKPLTKEADQLRGVDVSETHTIHDSLLQTQRLIQEKLGPYFGLNRAVSFASSGKGGGG